MGTSGASQTAIANVDQLRDADVDFHSSLFKLQTIETMKQIALHSKQKQKLSEIVATLCEQIKAIPQGNEQKLDEVAFLKKLKAHLPIKSVKVGKGTFHFVPPSKLGRMDNSVLQNYKSPKALVDLVFEIPAECIDAKDFLNFRYFHKRALYLCVLAGALRRSALIDSVAFSYLHGDQLRPILILNICGKMAKHAQIRLLPRLPLDCFKLSRFLPSSNNIRPAWFYAGTELAKAAEFPATPNYNNSLLLDMLLFDAVKTAEVALSNLQNVRDGMILVRLWLKQRHLVEGFGCFSDTLLLMLIFYLIQKHKLNSHMNSYQAFRATIAFLSRSDWSCEGLSFCDYFEPSVSPRPTLADFHAAFDVVFVDSTGYLNFAAQMHLLTYERVKHEARMALQILDKPDPFEALFINDVCFLRKFDHVLRIQLPSDKALQLLNKKDVAMKRMDLAGNSENVVLTLLTDLLRKALGRRIDLLDVQLAPNPQVDSRKLCSSSKSQNFCFTLGLLLNNENFAAVLDKGPQGNSSEAQEFRAFWGEKSELRKFSDVSVCEAVVWNAPTAASRRVVCEQIVRHVLKRHLSIPDENIVYVANQLDPLLSLPSDVQSYKATGEELLQDITLEFEKLSKALRLVEGLPLSVSAINPVSEASRLTEVFPPLPNSRRASRACVYVHNASLVPRPAAFAAPEFCPSMEVQITLEGSGKWPDDANAIKCLKTAFYLKLSELLRQQFRLQCVPYIDRLLVYQGSFVFSIVIAYAREILALKMTTSETGALKMVETPAAAALEKQIVALPKLASAIRSLALQEPSFGLVCRLAKRWIAAHLLLDYLQPEAVELIVAHLFLHPEPFSAPKSPINGFLRFLDLLATFDWLTNPLVVNFNHELSANDIFHLRSEFVEKRPVLPPLCICTPYDRSGTLWTKPQPVAIVVERLIKLANAAREILATNPDFVYDREAFRALFRTSFDSYDVLIHLVRRHVPQRFMSLAEFEQRETAAEPTKSALEIKKREKEDDYPHQMPVIDFDPVAFYLEDLREEFMNCAYFFRDKFGGATIAVAWKNPFKETVKKDADSLTVTIERFKKLGKGLAANVEVCNRLI